MDKSICFSSNPGGTNQKQICRKGLGSLTSTNEDLSLTSLVNSSAEANALSTRAPSHC